MLKIDINRIARKKGIMDATELLRNIGYERHKAWRMTSGRMKKWDMKDIEKLCELFKCSPNDLYVFVPEKGKVYAEGHGLRQLIRMNEGFDVVSYMRGLGGDEVKEIEKKILGQ